jgi:hypothetical protein
VLDRGFGGVGHQMPSPRIASAKVAGSSIARR